MLDRLQDDIALWMNYSPGPSPDERERVHHIVADAAEAERLLDFGFRPPCLLDVQPAAMPRQLDRPFEVTYADMFEDELLVDTSTGYRFRWLPDDGGLVFDLAMSRDYIDALELRMLAATRARELPFVMHRQPTYVGGPVPYVVSAPHFHPLTLRVASRAELDAAVEQVTALFCERCGAKRLWLRGQRAEYHLPRDAELAQRVYGTPREISLPPSAGRFAAANPERMGFGLAFAGPNHAWKKPFLVWMMRENAAWFRHDPRALDLLLAALIDEDEMRFVQLLSAMQLTSALAGLPDDVQWPDEADDLRQWFFAFMKPHSFGVTLQQYGYVTSLLDLTESVDVALYFTHAAMIDGRIRRQPPGDGRVIYVFAERRTGDFFRHGRELFWGDEDWVRRLPPRLERQRAGFLMGAHCRARNFYANMVVARIELHDASIVSDIEDEALFPTRADDLLYDTLIASRPPLEGLY